MWKIKLISTLVFLFFSVVANAQYGNDWINDSQTYYKFKIAEDGFYRITRSDLQLAGFPVSTVESRRIQLFREGEEVALLVESLSSDNPTIDYLEFYGTRKDGTSDSELYDEGDQPHTFYNLFTDSASYFITYKLGSESGKRMAFSSDKNASGLTPESYHLEDSVQVFSSAYAGGRTFSSNLRLSKYDRAEGWTNSFQTKNGFSVYDFNLIDRTNDVPTTIEAVLIGGNNQNHNVEISAGPEFTVIDNVEFNGHSFASFNGIVPESAIQSDASLTIRVLAEGFPDTAERISVAYMRVLYPQGFDLAFEENKLFTLDNVTERKAWLQVQTINAENTNIFNVTDPHNVVRIAKTDFDDRVEAVISDVSVGNKILAVTTPKSVPAIEEVDLPAFDLSDKDYLIITHPLLRTSGDPVNEYKMYRESEIGGGHAVEVANIQQIYDVFGYGDPSVLAITRYLNYAYDQTNLEFVFLIGKGFTPNFNYYRGDQQGVNVPTFGFPGTDMNFVFGLGSDARVPGVPIGRLNATSPNDVTAYLNKVRTMEELPYDDLFRKDFIQLSGGFTDVEINRYRGYVSGFTDVLENDFIGGRAFNTSKRTSEFVEFIDISDRVNQGVGYITFFGHSSGLYTDIEIGNVSDPSFGFQNQGKYPLFLVNGCKAGEIFGTGFTFSEDWVLTPDLGAIGFIAHTDIAFDSDLRDWSNLFYGIGFGDSTFVSRSIGETMVEVSKRYLQTYGGSDRELAQLQQMQLQGDPSFRLFGADYPDYEVSSNFLNVSSLSGQEVLATLDSFKVDIVVRNFGRSIQDSVLVQVSRIYPNGDQDDYVSLFPRPLRQDTLIYKLPIDPVRDNSGINLLTIQVDPLDQAIELDETNNLASIEFQILDGNTINLYPADNATTSTTAVEFVWQSSSLLAEERAFDMEFDTDPDFASSNNRSFTISGEVLLKQAFDFSALPLDDTTTVYWRTRIADPLENESDEWVESSFTIINSVSNGWGQYESRQILSSSNLNGIALDETTGTWNFIETETPIQVSTFGTESILALADSLDNLEILINNVDLLATTNNRDPFCEFNTFNAIAFDAQSGSPYEPVETDEINEFNREVCGRLPQVIYQFREQEMIGPTRRFNVLVNSVKEGDILLMFNMGNVNYSSWDGELIADLNSVGVSTATITSLVDGQPVIFLGRKGATPGSATEITNDGTTSPIAEQEIQLSGNVNGSFTNGQILSERIGPASSWDGFNYSFHEEVNDGFTLDLVGIANDGSQTPIVSRARTEEIDISTIDPILYPELQLHWDFEDEVDRTPPQLDYWEVSFSYPAEGMLLPTTKTQTSLQEGEEITRQFRFVNISEQDFADSLTVMATIVNQNSEVRSESSFRIAPPQSGDSTIFNTSFSSFGMTGSNTLIVEVQANENETYAINNRVTLANAIEITADETNPILDVTFDGYHILDGDVVSPNPTISVMMKDDNDFLFKSDTIGVTLSMRLPGDESIYQRINFSDPRVSYALASETQDFEVTFSPGPLDDGIYGLRVQAEDETGNQAGLAPYEINFEVINESTITHFYPYPNPFSTSCRFVFTLTGSEVPDQMKIQIITVSGRVVREITQDEIGPVRIGNNITTYAWDGRDEFGDQLANGVYFYKVFINANGEKLGHRSTSADRAFKNGFGKLYILR